MFTERRCAVRLGRLASACCVVAAASAVLAAGLPAQASVARPKPSATTTSHLWSWGDGQDDNLGTGNDSMAVLPKPIPALASSDVTQVVSPTFFSPVLALTTGHTIYAWGQGPLGNGTTGANSFTNKPVELTSLPDTVEIAATSLNGDSLVAAGGTDYALLGNGTVWAWGYGKNGELGNGSLASVKKPVRVKGLTGVKQVVAGGDTGYALLSDGSVEAWGQGKTGELGNGSTALSDVPVKVSLPGSVSQLASFCGSAYAIIGGQVYAWGTNNVGQLGTGSTTSSATPVLVQGVSDATSLTAGCFNAYAITGSSGQLMAWGKGAQGEMGDGQTANQPTPALVTGLTGVTQVSVGDLTTYAVSDGKAYAWGVGTNGQLGDGKLASSDVPVAVTGITSPVSSVVPAGYPNPGEVTIVALGTDGSLWSWGWAAFDETAKGGANQNPGKIPNVPAATGVYTQCGAAWFISD
jgi:alpha-tubulin suppressor-like RCC1 family protein